MAAYSSSINEPTLKSNNPSTNRKPLVTDLGNDIEIDETAAEAFINSLELPKFLQLNEEEQDSFLSEINVHELQNVIKYYNQELSTSLLDNYVLKDFLERNDPELLVGLEQQRATAKNAFLSSTKATVSGMSAAGSGLSSYQSRTVGSQEEAAYGYKWNYRTKTNIAEKMASDAEKRMQEMEMEASNQIQRINIHMEEMSIMEFETQGTVMTFKLHFLGDQLDLVQLNMATEKQVERKFRKFVNNWVKSAQAVLPMMHLKIEHLQMHCQWLQSELTTKVDLSGILKAIDYEKLIIKRTELLNALEEKDNNISGLKVVTDRTSLTVTQEKQIVMNLVDESKQLTNKTLEVKKFIDELEKETQRLEKDNQEEYATLAELDSKLEQYEEPGVHQYVEKKKEVLALEKEEKMLRRKLYILSMQVGNALQSSGGQLAK